MVLWWERLFAYLRSVPMNRPDEEPAVLRHATIEPQRLKPCGEIAMRGAGQPSGLAERSWYNRERGRWRG
jgi:hypothetical protein